MDEFELIGRCFRDRTTRRAGTVLGIGDDAALVDTAGLPLVHAGATTAFSDGGDAAAGAARHAFGAAFIRLSARAVRPRWATLGLTLGTSDRDVIGPFSDATAAVCDACGVELIGGDTTRGPGRATVFALGSGTAFPGGAAPRPSSAAARMRLSLASAEPFAHAVATLIPVCVDLAARGAGIRCEVAPGTRSDPRPGALELVARTDETGIDTLREVAARLGLDATPLEPDGC